MAAFPTRNPMEVARLSLEAFRELHLLSAWVALDKASGVVYRHEVRRDRSTGLTLSAKWPAPKASYTSKRK
jgi:hypothetical protein